MDKMEEWEVMEFYDVVTYSDYSAWEQTRLILSCYADHKKVKKLSDIIEFPWDRDKNNRDTDKEISKAQIDKMKKMSQEYLKYVNNETVDNQQKNIVKT